MEVLEALKEICRGEFNDAYRFCRALYIWIQVQDDLFDRDKPVTAANLATTNMNFLIEVSNNQFYRENSNVLLPVLMSASLAWVSSEEFAKRESLVEKIASQVIKSDYQSVFFQVALLMGGIDHALAMQSKYRSYYFDQTP